MFGNKKEEELKPMAGYPTANTKAIKDCLSKQKDCQIINVKWENVKSISVDRVTIVPYMHNEKRLIELKLEPETTSTYIKAWKRGLGKFILPDFKKQTNLDKYKFVCFKVDENKVMYAFVRFVTESDEDVDTLKHYKAITFDYTIKNAKFYIAVLKIFSKKDILSLEDSLAFRKKISNIDDEYYEIIDLNTMSSTYFISDENDMDDLKFDVVESKDSKVEMTPESDEYINEERLF